MVEDGWGRDERGRIVVGGKDKEVKSKRKVLGGISENGNRVEKKKGVRGRK